MKKNILVIAAPFGYGPASIALLIADALAEGANVTILSNRDAYQFVDKYKKDGVRCREGVFGLAYSRLEDLAQFDSFISVSNEPAVHYLIQSGFSSRTVFVDCLLPWRSARSSGRFARNILAYLVQDYPGAARYLRECRADRVELTAPMVWNSGETGTRLGKEKSVIMQIGGVTSPLVSWEMIGKTIKEVIGGVIALSEQHGRHLTIIGSKHLNHIQTDRGREVSIRADVSPREAAALINSAELVLTTPGIGTIYEAIVCGTPVVLLPPMNSTQLSQYGVFTGSGFPGLINCRDFAEMFEKTLNISWDKQTAYTIEWLNMNSSGVLAETEGLFAKTFAEDKGNKLLADIVKNQNDFHARLSKGDVAEIIGQLMA